MEPNNFDPNNANNESADKNNVNKYIVVLIAVAAVVFVAVAFLFISKDSAEKAVETEKANLFAGLNGTVYLTMAVKDDNAANLYTLDIETRRIEKTYGDTFVEYTASVSPSGDKIAYFASPIDRRPELDFPFYDPLQLYSSNLKSEDSENFEQITNGPLLYYFERLPAWSPDGEFIAYTALPKDEDSGNDYPYNDPVKTNSWSVYVADLEGNEEEISVGSYPQWSPDGTKILLMRDSGLYLYDRESETSEKVFSALRGNTTSSMKMKLSQDGSMLAWSRLGTRDLTVYTITSWDPFVMEEKSSIRSINSTFFWPVFSPNGQYVIAQAVDFNRETRERTNHRLVAYDVETMESVVIQSLEEYNFDVTFITDWR